MKKLCSQRLALTLATLFVGGCKVGDSGCAKPPSPPPLMFSPGDVVETVLDGRRGQVVRYVGATSDSQLFVVWFAVENKGVSVAAAGGGLLSGGNAGAAEPYCTIMMYSFELKKSAK